MDMLKCNSCLYSHAFSAAFQNIIQHFFSSGAGRNVGHQRSALTTALEQSASARATPLLPLLLSQLGLGPRTLDPQDSGLAEGVVRFEHCGS